MIKILKTHDPDFDQQLELTLAFEGDSATAVEVVVEGILEQIKANGDAALIALTNKYDHTAASSMDDLRLVRMLRSTNLLPGASSSPSTSFPGSWLLGESPPGLLTEATGSARRIEAFM